ncbi:hypothetical protein KAZ57_00055 [Patescibacteria group bacterium]|nr:hypothetical protein [Patescibacteria group bacterium]
MNTSKNKKVHPYSRPLLPAGGEVYVGLVMAVLTGFFLQSQGFYPIYYILSAVFVYLSVVFGLRLWFEDARKYWQAEDFDLDLRKNLTFINDFGVQIKKTSANLDVANGVRDSLLILDELEPWSSTLRYGGLSDLATYIMNMLTIGEYVDLQKHPSKGGATRNETMELAEKGFDGFAQQVARMLVRVNDKDASALTRTSEHLKSFRDLMGLSNDAQDPDASVENK